jgi:cellobiose phosphorylase
MVVLPLVEGLLGAEPDAAAGRITVAPQLPEAWTRLEVLGLRCADSSYDLTLQRRDGALAIALRRTLGAGLRFTLAPWLPTLPRRVEVNGQEVRPEVSGWGPGLRCAVTLEAAAEDEVRYVLK